MLIEQRERLSVFPGFLSIAMWPTFPPVSKLDRSQSDAGIAVVCAGLFDGR